MHFCGKTPETGSEGPDFPKGLIRWYVFFIQPLFLGKSWHKSVGKSGQKWGSFGNEILRLYPLSDDQNPAGWVRWLLVWRRDVVIFRNSLFNVEFLMPDSFSRMTWVLRKGSRKWSGRARFSKRTYPLVCFFYPAAIFDKKLTNISREKRGETACFRTE